MGVAFAYSSFAARARRASTASSIPTPGDIARPIAPCSRFPEGGFLGRGPGEGTIKTALPDAHTDFIFAVVAEEYGVSPAWCCWRCSPSS